MKSDFLFLPCCDGARAGMVLGLAGRSMEPTLDELDLLEVESRGARAIRVGDVVVFGRPDAGRLVAHRVIEVRGDGLKTRGDANRGPDPWVLPPEDVRGRVVAAQRGRKRRPIHGGALGLRRAQAIRLACILGRGVAAPLRGRTVSALLRHLIRTLMPELVRPRVIVARGDGTPRLFVAAGSRLLARYDLSRDRWQVNRLGRLLIEPDALPSPDQLTPQVTPHVTT